MSQINLLWQMYITDETKYQELHSNLMKLTNWFISSKFDKLKVQSEDIFHDLQFKIIQKRNDVVSKKCSPIKDFKAWYYLVMRNYLIDIERRTKREKVKINNYLKFENEGEQNMNQSEDEILLKFAKIMAIQNNKAHVDIFIDFVKGATYHDIANKNNVTNENARKIVERMRKECRRLWETDKVQVFNDYISVSISEAQTLFGKKKEEAILSLIKRLIGEIPKEYKEYLIKSLV